ncbi:MAG TPA: WYL domain-containing protein [Ilumatobacteraceae bacterium]|nr:WYL domain-containing protein [Ilumatobacteraceae bacterium]
MAGDDRVERLTNLLALLLETSHPLTLVEIAGELEGQYADKESTRRAAFERDKAALREIGVPIETAVLTGGQAGVSAYWIDRDRYELTDLHLEPDEMRALQVAVAAVRPTQGREALWKLGLDTIDGEVAGDVAVTATVPELPGLPALRDASARRRTVAFDYRGKARRLDPYGLLLRTGFWYVVGRDHEHAEPRTYRVDRIEGAVEIVEDSSFERPDGIDLRHAFPSDPKELGAAGGTAAVATVRVDGLRAAGVERELGADRVVARGRDGSIDVEVPCANVPAFRSWVLGLLEHAEVLAPPDVRAAVVSWLRAVADR